MFKGSDRPKPLPTYQSAAANCPTLDLSSEKLTGKNLRALVQCLNGNHSLDELQSLLSEASDAQADALADLAGRALLGDSRQAFASKATIDRLKGLGEWEASVKELGAALENPEYVQAILRFLSASRGTGMALSPVELEAFAILLREFDADSLDATVRVLRLFVASQRELRPRLRTPKWTAADFRRALHAGMTLRDSLAAISRPEAAPFWSALLDRDGGSLPAFTDLLLKDGGKAYSAMGRLHGVFDRPISCLGGGKVFAEPWKSVSEELGRRSGDDLVDFLTRFPVLVSLTLKPLCQVAPEFEGAFAQYASIFRDGSDAPLVSVLEAAAKGGVSVALGTWLGRSGSDALPILREAYDSGWLDAGMAVAMQLRPEDREWIRGRAGAFLQPRAELDGKSLYDVVGGWLLRLGVEEVDQVLGTVGAFFDVRLDGYEATLSRALALSRMGGEHPWLDGLRALALHEIEAQRNGQGTALTIADLSELPSFRKTVDLLFRMSQDGRLAKLVDGIYGLLNGLTEKGRREIAFGALAIPPLERKTERTFRAALAARAKAGTRVRDPRIAACLRVDLGKPLEAQTDLYLQCLGRDRENADFYDALAGLRPEASGAAILPLALGWLRSFPLRGADGARFADDLMAAAKDGTVAKWGDALSQVGAGAAEPTLLALARVRATEPAFVANALRGAGRGLRAGTFPDLALGIADAIGVADPGGWKSRPANAYDTASLRLWVRNQECVRDPSAANQRVRTLVEDYESGVDGIDWSGSNAKRAWTEDELWERLRPLFVRASKGNVRAALKRFLARHSSDEIVRWFTARANDFRPVPYLYRDGGFANEDVLDEPRVRLMSTLDRLDSIVNSANFRLPKLLRFAHDENFALMFMRRIGEAWGDVPRAQWPAEIQRLYPGSARAPTQREVYEDMREFLDQYEGMGAIPRVSECDKEPDPRGGSEAVLEHPAIGIGFAVPEWLKANVYNLHQALPVVEENLPDARGAGRGGMFFLRDLFFEVYYSGDADARDDTDEARNELALVLDLGREGLLRQLSLHFMREGIATPASIVEQSAALEGARSWILAEGGEALLGGWALNEGAYRDLYRRLRAEPGEPVFEAMVRALSLAQKLGVAGDLAPLVRALAASAGPGGSEVARLLVREADFDGVASALRAIGVSSIGRNGRGREAISAFARDAGIARDLRVLVEQAERDPTTRAFLARAIHGIYATVRSSEFQRLRLGGSAKNALIYLARPENRATLAWAASVLEQSGAIWDYGMRKPDAFSAWWASLLRSLHSPAFDRLIAVIDRNLPR